MKCWEGVKGGKYYLVQTLEQFNRVIEEAHEQEVLAVDTETSGFDWWKDHVAGFVIGWDVEHNYYIPESHTDWETGERLVGVQLSLEEVRDPLNKLLKRTDTIKYFWNAKFDLHFLKRSGIEVGGVVHDGFIASFLLDENADHGLKYMGNVYIDPEADKWDVALDRCRADIAKKKRSIHTALVNNRIAELQNDPKLLAEAYEVVEKQIVEEGLHNTLDESKLKRKRTTYVKRIFREVARQELEGTFISLNGKKDITYDQVPLDVMAPYAAADSHYTLLTVPKLVNTIIKDENLTQLYINEMKLLRTLFGIEQHGVKIDKEYLLALGPELEEDARKAAEEVYKHVGYEFNIGATQQLVAALKKAGCKLDKITKGSQEKLDNNEITISQATLAADNEVLERLATKHSFAKNVMDYRRCLKLKSTYVDGILSKLDDNNYLHSNFNQNVRTGRMSSRDPNLQNIDSKDKKIKKAFLAPDDGYFVFIDYSQIELRVLAHYCQDPLLLSCYPFEGEGRDVHSLTTAQVLRSVSYEDFLTILDDYTGHDENSVHCECPACLAKEDRKIGKTSNFLMVFGGGGATLQRQISTPEKFVPLQKCYEIVDNYKQTYSGMTDWIQAVERHVWKTGSVQNSFGRYRRFPDIKKLPQKQRYGAFRQGYNFLVQGTSADIFKYSIVKIDRFIKGTGIRIVNLVHDDIQFYVPKDKIHYISEIVNIMEDFSFSVPILADVEISKTNWANKKELPRELLKDLNVDTVEGILRT